MSTGTILHINAVGFPAAIEMNLDRSLKAWPFVVANERAPRAVVIAPSPSAHREGVRPGMVLSMAKSVCPKLAVRPPQPELYRKVEDTLRSICFSFTPLVEHVGTGHLYLDLAGTSRLFGAPEDTSQKLRARIYQQTGLTPTLGLSSNKTVSKVATRVFRPSGFIALSANEESQLLRHQPAALLPGIGPMLLGRLSLLDIDEIGQIADLTEAEARALGPRGLELVMRARGIDTSPVDPEPVEQKTVRSTIVFEPDTSDPEIIKIRLRSLVGELGFALRKANVGTHRASMVISYTDGPTTRVTVKTSQLLVRDDEIFSLAVQALERAKKRRVRIRRLELILSDIDAAGGSLDLFEPEELRLFRLQSALDKVHGRFGFEALVPCSALLVAHSLGGQS